jgi:hypothetical protein
MLRILPLSQNPEILPWVKDILHLAERLNQKQKILEDVRQKHNIRHKL